MTVVERVVKDMDELEVYCPSVIHPGDFFNCRIDVPIGSELSAKIEIRDDVNTSQNAYYSEIKVPGTIFFFVCVL